MRFNPVGDSTESGEKEVNFCRHTFRYGGRNLRLINEEDRYF